MRLRKGIGFWLELLRVGLDWFFVRWVWVGRHPFLSLRLALSDASLVDGNADLTLVSSANTLARM